MRGLQGHALLRREPGEGGGRRGGQATICGDCRVTPFYDVNQVMAVGGGRGGHAHF